MTISRTITCPACSADLEVQLTLDLSAARLMGGGGHGVVAVAVDADPGTNDSGTNANVARTSASDKPDIAEVWAHYEAVVPGGSRYRLDPKRRTLIANALKVRDIAVVKKAISGLAVSPFHNGENDRGKKYLGLRYALQGIGSESNDERIDKMAALADQHAKDPLSHIPSGAREMVRTRQRQVEDMLLNPGDRTLLARGGGSVTYLRETWDLTAYIDGGGNVQWIAEVGGAQ